MRHKITLFLLILSAICTFTASSFANDSVSFNPRDDYQFGVGSVIGGPYGIVGISAAMNWFSTLNFEVGAGSGIYFDTYNLHARYLIMDDAFTPFVGGGLAYWDSQASGQKLADNSTQAVDLGMVNDDGSELRGGIVLLPLSLGLSYVSEMGLSLFVDFEFMISTANIKGIPYGSLGFQWYF